MLNQGILVHVRNSWAIHNLELLVAWMFKYGINNFAAMSFCRDELRINLMIEQGFDDVSVIVFCVYLNVKWEAMLFDNLVYWSRLHRCFLIHVWCKDGICVLDWFRQLVENAVFFVEVKYDDF